MKPPRKPRRRKRLRSTRRRARLSPPSRRKLKRRRSARKTPSPLLLHFKGRRSHFVSGYSRFRWPKPPFNTPKHSVAAIVAVMDEEGTIGKVIAELKRLPLNELIIVVNGSFDRSFSIIREQSDAIIVHYSHPLGHDVGRAIGAKIAKSDILLFVDGDMQIPAEQMMPFIQAVDRGLDIALNDLTSFLGVFSQWDAVSMVKEFVNRSLLRPDLRANSLTAVPHAMSKAAAESIGYDNLAVPPKAQAIALQQGLNIRAPVAVNVIRRNRIRPTNHDRTNPVAELIIGDHVEALAQALNIGGPRLSYPDLIRKRNPGETT